MAGEIPMELKPAFVAQTHGTDTPGTERAG
jgi:hypothetical protein